MAYFDWSSDNSFYTNFGVKGNEFRILIDWDKDWCNKPHAEVVLDEFKEKFDNTLALKEFKCVAVFLTRKDPYPYLAALAEHRWGWKVELFPVDPLPWGIEEDKKKAAFSENYKRRDKLVMSCGINYIISFTSTSVEEALSSPKWAYSTIHGHLRTIGDRNLSRSRKRIKTYTIIPPWSPLDLMLHQLDKKVPYLGVEEFEAANEGEIK